MDGPPLPPRKPQEEDPPPPIPQISDEAGRLRLLRYLTAFGLPPAITGPYIIESPEFGQLFRVPLATAEQRRAFLANGHVTLPLVLDDYHLVFIDCATGERCAVNVRPGLYPFGAKESESSE